MAFLRRGAWELSRGEIKPQHITHCHRLDVLEDEQMGRITWLWW
jgi:hypothetical protein